MHIISGRYKGRLIKFPKDIRPTQDKVRKALFDILGDITGFSFLDLFAGSGSVGIEALSRGVLRSVFVENRSDCIKILNDNLKFLKPETYNVYLMDVFAAIERFAQAREKFDIIFLDPPYSKGMAKNCLIKLSGYDIVSSDSLTIIQHFKKDILPTQVGFFRLLRQSVYGDTVLTFYNKVDFPPAS